ncbi:hypothetical protein HYV83_03110 [Candidatus Woesearchaeota archaeon]|nr:hypothetical protein [Candidatus Woesearchaeota archaeon]
MFELAPFAGLALLLGFKHSYDADHLIAVANLLRKTQTLKSALKMSASWALGHMITAAIVTTILYVFRESLLTAFLASFEKIVGVMLILLGLFSLKDLFGLHSHVHEHEGLRHEHPHHHVQDFKGHIHKHMLGIGVIHGLASNDELLILFTASLGLTTLGNVLLGVAVFSLGVVAGMVLFALLFSYPLLKSKSDAVYKAITLVTGIVSVAYGMLMLAAVV